MRPFLIKPPGRFKGEINLPGDKSIAHRCLIISAISQGKTIIENFPSNKDCLYTLRALRLLGIKIDLSHSGLACVYGKGLSGLSKPKMPIYTGESGTTLRLLLGLLAAQKFEVKLTAGSSLRNRPMGRVTQPLRMMGADIKAKVKRKKEKVEEYPPIIINGGNLKSITYRMPLPSAQVKSAILLAGLYAQGVTKIIEPLKSRDHTERMLNLFKADIKLSQNNIVIKGGKELISPGRIYIPGDISSAAFFMVAASIIPDAEILIKDVSLNPSRTGIIKVLRRMGADIRCTGNGIRGEGYEPVGDISVRSAVLKGTIVERDEIPFLIDEIPILMVAACCARGKTVFKGVNELRVKETDRIKSMSIGLNRMGAKIRVVKKAKSESIVLEGPVRLRGANVESAGDHRTAMSLAVAGLKAKGNTLIDDIDCISKSFPEFLRILKTLIE